MAEAAPAWTTLEGCPRCGGALRVEQLRPRSEYDQEHPVYRVRCRACRITLAQLQANATGA